MQTFKRILVPTDFSSTSDAALDYAKALARRFGSTLTLLHVVELPASYNPEAAVVDLEALRQMAHRDAQRSLRVQLLPKERDAFDATFTVLDGAPVSQIVRYAAEYDIDLIVMGTHGRTGLVHVLLGSVAERTVRTAPCPVLTVRALGIPETAGDPAREFVAVPAAGQVSCSLEV
jgi:universal stress protein A